MLDALIWFVWLQVFSLAGYAVGSCWLRNLPDKGYGASKALGIILCGFVYWLAVTAGFAPNTVGAALLALAVVGSAGLLWRTQLFGSIGTAPLSIALAPPKFGSMALSLGPAQIATEAIFLAGYIACALYRAYNPNIDSAGGEKYMESMMLNAILRSETFPPNDAWLSGYPLSYYYFGYIQQAMLTLVSGVRSSVAFNLAGATTFALTLSTAFCAGYNLWSLHLRNATNNVGRSPILAGALTATLLACMGNMGGMVESGRCSGLISREALQWLDVKNSVPDQASQYLEGCVGARPNRFYWWWTWSRVVNDRTPAGQQQEAIGEFPAFSFALGDNHPHVMNLPFVTLTLIVALALFMRSGDAPPSFGRDTRDGSFSVDGALRFAWQSVQPWPEFLLLAILVGGLSFMNTWDFPMFGAMAVGAVILRRWLMGQPLGAALINAVAVFVLGYLLYYPWYITFSSQAKGLAPNLFNGTPLKQFFLQFGPFVLLMPAFLMAAARAVGVRSGDVLRAGLLTLGGLLGVIVLTALVAFTSPTVRDLWNTVSGGGSVFGVSRQMALDRIAQRFTDPFVPLLLLGCAALAAVVLGKSRGSHAATPSAQTFVVALFAMAALIVAVPEFVFLLDNFGTRMNTLFKFWFMGWVMLAVGSGFAIMHFTSSRKVWMGGVAAVSLMLMLGGLLYPIYTALSRTNNFGGRATLDGAAYLSDVDRDDAQLIAWLNANTQGDLRLAEAPGDKFASYKYEGRISAFTGLPTPLGWGGHENQWRGNYDAPSRREGEIESLYNTPDLAEARRVIRVLGLDYVVVGETERRRYTAEGLAKFDQLGKPVTRSGNSVIYKVR